MSESQRSSLDARTTSIAASSFSRLMLLIKCPAAAYAAATAVPAVLGSTSVLPSAQAELQAPGAKCRRRPIFPLLMRSCMTLKSYSIATFYLSFTFFYLFLPTSPFLLPVYRRPGHPYLRTAVYSALNSSSFFAVMWYCISAHAARASFALHGRYH